MDEGVVLRTVAGETSACHRGARQLPFLECVIRRTNYGLLLRFLRHMVGISRPPRVSSALPEPKCAAPGRVLLGVQCDNGIHAR